MGRVGKGTAFLVKREHVGGNLENALQAFKKAIIDEKYMTGHTRRPTGKLTYTYDESKVRRYPATKSTVNNDLDIELDLGELSL